MVVMTDESGQAPWFPPAMMKRQLEEMQQAGEQVAESQQELITQFMQAQPLPFEDMSSFGPMNMGTATFKARVQSGGRISVPEPERDALDIEEGDIVQTVVIPVKRPRDQE